MDNYQLSLDRAISISERALNEIISGERKPSKSFLNKVSDYFSLPLHILLNDEEELPLDKLVIDKDLVSIQRKDIENELQRHKEKRSFKRNWLILSHGSRIRVVLTSLAVILPLLAYTAYCSYILIEDRVSTTSEYVAEQSLSEEEEKIIENQEALLAKEEKSYQVTVDIGINVAKITNVSNSGMSFSPTMQLFFDFDNEDYFRMIYAKENSEDYDEEHPFVTSNPDKYRKDDFGYNESTGSFYKSGDGVPDYMQLDGYSLETTVGGVNFYSSTYQEFADKIYNDDGSYKTSDEQWDALDATGLTEAQIYEKVIANYPGKTSSNNYPDNETLFSIGHYNGSFDADAFSYEYITPYALTDPEGNVTYRYFMSMSFSASIGKVYSSPRYPLDSVSFTIPITSEKMTYQYLKYNPVDYVDLTEDQLIRSADPNYGAGYKCSIDANYYSSGTGTNFKISTGYQLFETSSIKSVSKKVVARKLTESDSENQSVAEALGDSSKVYFYSEFQMVLNANRSGISLFLQAFINLFAVVIWIVIAFYDESYHNESAIGMLGTGLFGAISSILVGLSMVSEAGIFSLITMINIFTLGVILIMTVHSILAKRAHVTADKANIAYYGVKLRVLFYALTLCTAIMFVALPFISYIFF
ncbi:MAG: helix-turn-helix transcriptional regulator [Bacillota bacterium]|nr:helix-turn-helix transcriptional regulator [Bacillota bacterium]